MSTLANLKDIATKQWSYSVESDEVINHAGWSPDGKHLALSCFPNFVVILDGTSGKEITRIDNLDFFKNHTLWIDGGQRLAIQVTRCLKIYQCDDWNLSSEIEYSASWHTAPDIDQSGKWVASGFKVCGDGRARDYQGFGVITIRNIDDWSLNRDFNTKEECGGVAWSPDLRLAHWDHFSRITIWDAKEQSKVQEISLPEDRVASITWHPSGETIVVGSKLYTNIYEYDVGSGKLTHKLDLHPDGDLMGSGVYCAAFSSNGKWFVSRDSTRVGRVIYWEADAWQPICLYEPKEGGARKRVPLVAIKPNEKTLLTPNDECTGLDVWCLE